MYENHNKVCIKDILNLYLYNEPLEAKDREEESLNNVSLVYLYDKLIKCFATFQVCSLVFMFLIL